MTSTLPAPDLANVLGIDANPYLRVRAYVVQVPTKSHSCDAQCGRTIERGEACVSLRVEKPKGGFCRYWHLGCAPESMGEPDPLPERRALRYVARTLSAARSLSDVPSAAWAVLAALRTSGLPF